MASGRQLGEKIRRPVSPSSSSTAIRDRIRVRRGDSMWKLSHIYLGAGKRWVRLWKVNPEVRNPHLIYPGQLLRWPDAPALARNQQQTPGKRKPTAAVTPPAGASAPGPTVAGKDKKRVTPSAALPAHLPSRLEHFQAVSQARLSQQESRVMPRALGLGARTPLTTSR